MKVNQILSKNRYTIVKALYRSAGVPVSGVALSQATGISRVAVWKHIKALKETGIEIDAMPTGYQLKDPGSLLYPFCFPENLKKNIHYFPCLDSTMDQARALARDGAGHASCVVAQTQTHSRGRLNRAWDSAKGGLWFTLILRPNIVAPLAWTLNFVASACMSEVLEQLFGLDVRVKWPNDLLLDGKKLSGMLSEMATRADMVDFLLLGIGLNVNNHPPEPDHYQAISLKQVLGRPIPLEDILSAFLPLFESRITDIDPARIIRDWKKRTATIGSQVRVQTHDQKVTEGTALDVDDTGTLIIETREGKIEKIIYGDCFHD